MDFLGMTLAPLGLFDFATSIIALIDGRSSRPAAFPKGCRYIALRDKLDAIFGDEMFSGLFLTHRRPADHLISAMRTSANPFGAISLS